MILAVVRRTIVALVLLGTALCSGCGSGGPPPVDTPPAKLDSAGKTLADKIQAAVSKKDKSSLKSLSKQVGEASTKAAKSGQKDASEAINSLSLVLMQAEGGNWDLADTTLKTIMSR